MGQIGHEAHLVSDALEHSPRNVPAIVRKGEPDERGASVVPPVRREEAAECGDEVETVGAARDLSSSHT